ncbi:MAG: ABC transporter permease [Victivallales bacterium]|nr:ABC transporter permease [Victivallales bacterium]
MLFFKLKRIIKLGFSSLVEHKLRSLLTALGIIFGVGSVIAMLAIGEGASHEAREQIRSLGSSNIIIRSVKPTDAGGEVSRMVTYGLTYEDARRIHELYPQVSIQVPARELQMNLRHNGVTVPGRAICTVGWAADSTNFKIIDGRFFDEHDMAREERVAVITRAGANRLFPLEHPIGKQVYIDKFAFSIVGIVENSTRRPAASSKSAKSSSTAEQAANREIYDIYIPLTTARHTFGNVIRIRESGSTRLELVELHQLTVTAPGEAEVLTLANSIRETIRQAHKKPDFEITVPLELLKQAEQTKRIFNIVLGSIAAISLLVGGIGIMNIMLASVTERTREIGIRRARGARRTDIVVQFLTEALLLSFVGGLIGIAMGIGVPKVVTHFAGLITIVQAEAIILAFSISLLIGIVFGIYPAIRAAALSPIDALRHE